MRIFVTILVLIVMLGILISTHEAGHLWAAKRFGVYCFEYSVGFGPTLISSKKWTKPLIHLGKKEEVKPDENGFVHAEKEELVASDTPSKYDGITKASKACNNRSVSALYPVKTTYSCKPLSDTYFSQLSRLLPSPTSISFIDGIASVNFCTTLSKNS